MVVPSNNFKRITQSYPRTCGQTCLAMLSGKTEWEIIKLIGHNKGTKTREIIKTLNALSIKNSGKLTVIGGKTDLPEIAIIKAVPKHRKSTGGGWHWVVKCGNKIYDPAPSKNLKRLRFTSFITIIPAAGRVA